jgi:hypothetical protein
LVAKNKKIKYTLPSAVQLALGKGGFAECVSVGARQSIKNTSLLSVLQLALGKGVFAECPRSDTLTHSPARSPSARESVLSGEQQGGDAETLSRTGVEHGN